MVAQQLRAAVVNEMSLSARNTRRIAAFALVLAALVLLSGYAAIFEFIGRRWPGFPIMANGVVGMRALAAPAVFDDLAGLTPGFRLVAISGTPVFSGSEAYAVAAAVPLGTPLRYELEALDGNRRSYTVPTQLFDQGVGFRIWAPILGVGVIFLATLSIPLLARPDLLATRALFAAALGITVQFCFALPDIFLGYRLGWLTWLYGWIGLAGGLNLALGFPIARWPLKRYPRRTLVGIWAGTALLLGMLGWLGYGEPRYYLVGEYVHIGLLVGAMAGIALNLGIVAWRHPDVALQRQSRLILPGLLIFAGSSFGAGIFNLQLRSHYVEPLVYFAPALIFATTLGVGMLRYDLFGFSSVARRLGGRAALLLAVLSGTFVLFALFEAMFDTALAWGFAVALSAVLLAVFAIWPPAFALVEGMLETIFLPEKQRARLALGEAAQEVSRLREASALAQYLEATIGEALDCSWVRFVVGAPDRVLTEVGYRSDRVRISQDDPLHGMICAGTSLTTQIGSLSAEGLRDAVLQARVLGVALVVPLPAHPGFVGAVLCGKRRESRPYSVADVSLVEMLSSAAGVAFENARAWDEVQALRTRLERENRFLRAETLASPEMGGMIGSSAALREAVRQIQQVAPTTASVMIVGETGTGKELAMEMLHRHSDRADQILVKTACAALPENLLESELFGHERGAFTGADERRIGRFEVADGGTLFFDDVDTLPLGIQAKLLRAIQEGEIQRLGSNEVRRVDVRIVSATNRDLLGDVRAGRFREDLYYRLNVVPVHLPPLRDRLGDIPDLAEHFVRAAGKSLGRVDITEIAAATIEELQAHSWPGNIREFRNTIERAMVMSQGSVLRLPGSMTKDSISRLPSGAATGLVLDGVSEVPAAGIPEIGSASMKELLQRHKRSLIEAALVESGGNQSRAAQLLGMHRSNLNRTIKELGIRVA